MIQPCQLNAMKLIFCDLSDDKNTWVFVLKQLADVFAIMAFDKLKAVMIYDSAVAPWQMNEMKAKKEDLDAAAQCEQMRSLFNNCIQHFLHLSEDCSNL